MRAANITAIPREQLSRTALLYVLAAFSACVSLLAFFLPWWILPVAVGVVGWRLLVFSGRLSFPPVWLKSVLVLLAGVALFLQYRFSVSLDVFVTLLLLGFSLKLLELYHRPDARLLLFLAFFVLMTAFLFDQLPGYALYGFLSALVVLAALVALHSAEAELLRQWWQPLRKAAVVFGLALPVMLFMFVVMPRLPPLWVMPLQKQQAKTGMSDSMSPGDIATLARSGDLAFRVTFAGELPPRRELYWRGMVFDRFDGVAWREACVDCLGKWSRSDMMRYSDVPGVDYQVILEPHGEHWLYALSPARIRDQAVWGKPDGVFRFAKPVSQRRVYEAQYLPTAIADTVLNNSEDYLALPATGNEQSRELAQQWRRDSSSDEQVLQKALAFYREHFYYTLQPPALGAQRVDEFLFRSRSGFCEHFAGSLVFLMRAAGIPARVVVGYMGGEVNTQERYVVVRQYDAHAWTEVWLPGRGWQRVDPTAAVSPDRIELGFADAFSGNEAFAIDGGLASYRHISLLNTVRLKLDYFNYLWVRWVLGYEGDSQRLLLQQLGLLSPWRMALWAGIGVGGMFVGLLLWLHWRQWWLRHEHPVTRRYRQLCHAYARYGIERLPAETPLQYAQRVAAADVFGAGQFVALSQTYYNWSYCPQEVDTKGSAGDFSARARSLYWQLLLRRITRRARARDKS